MEGKIKETIGQLSLKNFGDNAKYHAVFWFLTIITFLILIIITLIYLHKRRVKKIKLNKGKEKEKRVNSLLNEFAKQNNFKYISNEIYSVKNKQNKDIQFEVDGILITPYCVYVIEVKSANGFIEGSAAQEFIKDRNKSSKVVLKNPILQNKKHIEHLKNILDPSIPIFSLIIFATSNKINLTDINSQTICANTSDCQTLIVNHMKTLANSPYRADASQIAQIYSTICAAKANQEQIYIFEDIIGKYDIN